jgi:plasmid rolling circle replication initiator protein Rep
LYVDASNTALVGGKWCHFDHRALSTTGFFRSFIIILKYNDSQYIAGKKRTHTSVASAQLGFFITENAVIDVTVREMVNNIAPLYTFQIKKKLSKYMQPILKYSKNNM